MEFLWLLVMLPGLAYLYVRWRFGLSAQEEKLIEEVMAKPNDDLLFAPLQTVQLADTEICYEDIPGKSPTAETILLLHGLTQTMLSFPPYFVEAFLQAGYRVVRIDHQGGGGSSWVPHWGQPDKYNLRDLARHADEVMAHLNIESYHVVGISMGGMVAQCMAIAYPERVLSLTSMMSTAYMDDPEIKPIPRKLVFGMAYVLRMYGKQLSSLRGKLRFNLAMNRLMQGNRSYRFDHRSTVEAAHYEITHKKGFNGKARLQHGYAIRKAGSRIEALQKLSVPSLVVHGTHDSLVRVEHGRKTAALIPNCQTLFMEGLGHHLPRAFCAEITGAILGLVGEGAV
ncbi:MAG: alpha/beta hydrolase [Bacteroidota bacterium]